MEKVVVSDSEVSLCGVFVFSVFSEGFSYFSLLSLLKSALIF